MDEDKKEWENFSQNEETKEPIQPDYNYDFSFDKKNEKPYLNEVEQRTSIDNNDSVVSAFEKQNNNFEPSESFLTSEAKELEEPSRIEEQKDLFQEEKESFQNTYTPNETVEIELNRENLMEEALSHTTKYSPFVLPKEEEVEEPEKENKGRIAFIIILFAILFLAVLLIPKISTWL